MLLSQRTSATVLRRGSFVEYPYSNAAHIFHIHSCTCTCNHSVTPNTDAHCIITWISVLCYVGQPFNTFHYIRYSIKCLPFCSSSKIQRISLISSSSIVCVAPMLHIHTQCMISVWPTLNFGILDANMYMWVYVRVWPLSYEHFGSIPSKWY